MANLFTKLLSRGADRQLREFEKITGEVNDSADQIGRASCRERV